MKASLSFPYHFLILTAASYAKTTRRRGRINIELKYLFNENLFVHGGRDNALEILKNIQNFVNYGSTRNDLMSNTTHLSAYIKYGSVSIREVFNTVVNAFGINHVLIDQLLWREFY